MNKPKKISGCIIGIGVHGIAATAYIRERVLPEFNFVAISDQPHDSNVMDETLNLIAKSSKNKLHLKSTKTTRSTLRKMRNKFDCITIITDLAFENVALCLAKVFNREGQVVITIVMQPERRHPGHDRLISELHAHSGAILNLPIPATDCQYEAVKNSCYGLWSVLNQDNALFSLDWAELMNMLKPGTTGITIFESASGHDRALNVTTKTEQQLSKMMFTPSTSVLVNILHSDIAPFEIDAISSGLLKHIPDSTGLLFCITPVPEMAEINVFILATDTHEL